MVNVSKKLSIARGIIYRLQHYLTPELLKQVFAQIQVVSKKKKKRSLPKLRVIFRPKSEIQTFFSPKCRKKVFTNIESDFSAEIGNSNVFFAHVQVVSKKKKKKVLYQN